MSLYFLSNTIAISNKFKDDNKMKIVHKSV